MDGPGGVEEVRDGTMDTEHDAAAPGAFTGGTFDLAQGVVRDRLDRAEATQAVAVRARFEENLDRKSVV